MAVLSLALGIGGTTVMFGVLNALLLQPPTGVRTPEAVQRLYVVRNEGVVRTPTGGPGSYVDFRSLQRGTHNVEEVAAFLPVLDYDYGIGAEARRITARPVSGEFFPLLGTTPAQGRLLDLDDDRPSVPSRVAVLSHRFWRRDLGADPQAVGRSLRLNGEFFTVVGVASSEFTGIDTEPVDVWVPLETAADRLKGRADVALLEFIARLAPEGAPEQVRASAAAALAASAADHPELDPSPSVLLGPLNPNRGPQPSGVVRLAVGLWVATGMLLLIACANAANLLLARATTRRRELAVRRALGAGDGRIVRQLLTESILLALVAGALGLGLAVAAGNIVQTFPELRSVSWVDTRVLAFAVFASLATGLVFGVAPAIQPTRVRPVAALNEAQPTGGRAGSRLPKVLVVAQVALTVVLLASAGIFLRALQKAVTIDSGVDLDRLVVASVDLQSIGFQQPEAATFYERALTSLRRLPGVEGATVVMPLPLSGSGRGITVRSRPGGDYLRVSEGPYAYTVGADYFRTAGVRIVQGRALTDHDRSGAEPVAVLSESLARALPEDGDVVGRCIPVGAEQAEAGACTRIVGVATDVRHRYMVKTPMPYVYRPQAQVPFHEAPSMFTPYLLVRTATEPASQVGPIRSALQGLARDLPYVDVQLMETLVGTEAVRPFKIAAQLLTALGGLALFLAATGLYGTLSHFVADRTREVGLRVALGADRNRVVRLVVRQAMVSVGLGLALGLAGGALASQVLQVRLHGLSPGDPVALASVLVTLLAAALLATWVPARRAASVDPMVALRVE